MGILLRDTLRTICNGNHWSYAVLWKFGCQNPRLLIWEESYCELLPSSSHSILGDPKAALPGGASVRSGCKLDFLMCHMMNQSQFYVIGEGIVGRAAFTGNHEWILADDYIEGRYPPEVICELNYQFSSGIQTVAVIPFPHGVVQLGSSIHIMENVNFVNEVKSLILQLGFIPGALFPDSNSSANFIQRSSVPSSVDVLLPPQILDHKQFAHLIPVSNPNGKQLHSSTAPVTESSDHCRSNNYSISKNYAVEHVANLSNTPYELRAMDRSEQKCSDRDLWNKLLPGRIGESSLYQQSVSSEVLDFPRFYSHEQNGSGIKVDTCSGEDKGSCLDDSVSVCRSRHGFSTNFASPSSQAFANLCLPDTEITTFSRLLNPSDSECNFRSSDSVISSSVSLNGTGELMAARDQHHLCAKSATPCKRGNENYAKSVLGDELYDILGLDFKNQSMDEHFNLLLGSGEVPLPKNAQEVFNQSYCSDNLLDAVVTGGCPSNKISSIDHLPSAVTNNTGNLSDPSSSSVGGIVGVSESENKNLSDALHLMGKSSGSCSQDINGCSITTSGYGSQLTSWVSYNGKQDSNLSGLGKRSDESSKTPRKRLKPGENPRPRPKDRQMIQDRVKELREIVPNGTKCSIDALLERTIKHMQFLQSVTKHADKLKQAGESKLISSDGRVLFKDNFEGGKTWAYEVGSQSAFCPILVEDLNPPRQLLIEMLCEERGFFLEIADVIRSMGLTILKGVMECRNGKIWAQFAVEADKDVTRRQVFIALVNLLEQLKSDIQYMDNDHMRIHNAFYSATSIPATGRAAIIQ